MRPTPETGLLIEPSDSEQATWSDVTMDYVHGLERERDEAREELFAAEQLYDLDTQWLKAENQELRDALRVRLGKRVVCPECECCIDTQRGRHAETCRHFATEQKAMANAAGEGREAYPAPACLGSESGKES